MKNEIILGVERLQQFQQLRDINITYVVYCNWQIFFLLDFEALEAGKALTLGA